MLAALIGLLLLVLLAASVPVAFALTIAGVVGLLCTGGPGWSPVSERRRCRA